MLPDGTTGSEAAQLVLALPGTGISYHQYQRQSVTAPLMFAEQVSGRCLMAPQAVKLLPGASIAAPEGT